MSGASCLLCNSSRVLESGAREGALWCLLSRRSVGIDQCCHSFVPVAQPAADTGAGPLR